MDTTARDSAAQFYIDARRRGTPGPRLPADLRPKTFDDALAIQLRVNDLLGMPIGGYKCSLPAEGRPLWFAPIFAPTLRRESPCPVATANAMAPIEPEIAFVIGRDLPARSTPYSEADVRAAVKEARFVLEIIGSRYSEYGTPALTPIENLAEGIANQGLFVGPVLSSPWERKLEAIPLTLATPDGVFATRDGKHPDGHPFRPLVWLANQLASIGRPLREGMIVTTGSYCGIVEAPFGKPVTVTYGDLGSLTATLERK